MTARSTYRLRLIVFGLFFALANEACADPAPAATLYVVRRGWHVDVGYAKQDLREPLRSIAMSFPAATYVLFGFGDMHYLADVKNQHGPAMLAALLPGPGLILVTTLASTPSDAFGSSKVIALRLTGEQLQASQDYIWKSLVTQQQRVSVYRPGPYEGAYYFLAVPRYSALHTCNTWVAQSLRAASLPIRAQGVLFAHQLWSRARRLERHMKSLDPQLQGGRVPS